MAVLWLHGLGDSGEGWEGAFASLERLVPSVVFSHPTAPTQPLTCDGGSRTTSWFDITTWKPPVKPIGLAEPDNPKGIDDTVQLVHKELDKLEKKGVPLERVVIGGFSQGGTATILAGLTCSKKIGGIVSISGWATRRATLAQEVTEANKNVPILYCYGDHDEVVDNLLAKESVKALQPIVGDSLQVVEANRAMHQPSPVEMRAALDFMARILKPCDGPRSGAQPGAANRFAEMD